jgi:chaperonin GroEL
MSSFGDYQRDLMFDLAALTGATVLGEGAAKNLKAGEVEDCGTCETIIIGRKGTVISGGKGKVSERIEEVKTLIEEIKDDNYRKEKAKERLGKLTGSIANIKIGGASEAEQAEIKYRVEDALNATKSAIEEGIVEGGGMALLRCIDCIETDVEGKEFKAGIDIIKKALEMPLKTIVNNGGGNGEAIVGKAREATVGYNALTEKWEDLFLTGIIDPKKVVRHAIQNAVATASILLTADCAIAFEFDENDKRAMS